MIRFSAWPRAAVDDVVDVTIAVGGLLDETQAGSRAHMRIHGCHLLNCAPESWSQVLSAKASRGFIDIASRAAANMHAALFRSAAQFTGKRSATLFLLFRFGKKPRSWNAAPVFGQKIYGCFKGKQYKKYICLKTENKSVRFFKKEKTY